MILLEMPDPENRDNTVYEIDTLDNVITTLCVVPSHDINVRPMADRIHQFCQFLLIRCVRLNDRDLAFARRAGVQASVLDTDFKIRRICRRRI